MRSSSPLLFLIALGLLLPDAVHAQGVTVDEGTFRILVDGREIGTETFAIRRSGTGADAQVIATAEIHMEVPEGRLDLRPALQASGVEMAVSAYQIKVSGHTQEEVYVTLGPRRFLTKVRSERGEQEREYRATPGTLLLDTDVAHQYYFVSTRAAAMNGGTVPVIVPREGEVFDLTVTVVGPETIRIGGTSVEARHLRLEGRQQTRDLWVDGEGRVLRLEFPARGYVAERRTLP
jgi:hypothetical protein